MKIRLSLGTKSSTATLLDNPTAKDFVEMLPMKITLEDYAQTEKIFYLPKKLSTEGSPKGTKASRGDITYYAPWGNLAFFYKDFGYAEGLIKLGNIDSDVEFFNVQDARELTIELVND